LPTEGSDLQPPLLVLLIVAGLRTGSSGLSYHVFDRSARFCPLQPPDRSANGKVPVAARKSGLTPANKISPLPQVSCPRSTAAMTFFAK
jgi:hypothetical protein